MGCESSYRIRILSKQLHKLSFSTLINNNEHKILNPWFITGFSDAEGSFQISLKYDKKYKTK